MNQSPGYLFLFDIADNYRCLECSLSCETIFKWTKEAIIGRTLDELAAAIPNSAQWVEACHAAAQDVVPHRAFQTFIDSKGQRRSGQFFYQAVTDARGRRLVFVSVLDVTTLEQSRRDLSTSRALMDASLEVLPLMFYIKDADNDFRYIYASKTLATAYGFKDANTMIGKCNFDIFPDAVEENKAMLENDTRIIESMCGYDKIESVIDDGGSTFHMRIIKKPLISEDGRRLIIGTNINLTHLNHLALNGRTLNRCIEDLLTCDDNEKAEDLIFHAICTRLQAAYCYILDYDFENDCARLEHHFTNADTPFPDHFKTCPLPDHNPWYSEVLQNNYTCIPDISKVAGNESLWKYMGSYANVKSCYVCGLKRDGKRFGHFAVLFKDNIRILNEDEEDFFKMFSHIVEIMLDRNLHRQQLLSALKQAQDAAHTRIVFLASMSHEIRTPLNAVIGFAELLKDHKLAPQIQEEYLSNIANAGTGLLNLINDVLDFSKLESGKMVFKPVRTNFAALSAEVLKIFELRIKEKGLRSILDIEPMPDLMIDKLRVRQILFNLIGNAVKFTDEGSITVSSRFDRASHTLRFSIIDTGCGISKEDQETLFELFVQSKAIRGTFTANQGTGLGLAITRKILDGMNGIIMLDSTPGVGSCFTVEITHLDYVDGTSLPDEPGLVAPIVHPMPNRELTFLIVDDIAMNLKVISAMLAKLNIRAICLARAPEALTYVKENKVDAVLTDLWMQEINGVELAEKIHEFDSHLPVYAITADTEIHTTFDTSCFAGVLIKPVTLEKLHACVDTILQKG